MAITVLTSGKVFLYNIGKYFISLPRGCSQEKALKTFWKPIYEPRELPNAKNWNHCNSCATLLRAA